MVFESESDLWHKEMGKQRREEGLEKNEEEGLPTKACQQVRLKGQ
jgi:hypothetical protein